MTGPARRLVASALAWIVGAVAAIAVGVLALSMIGDDLTSRTAQPLSPDAVAREASAAPTGPATGPSEAGGSSEPAPDSAASPPGVAPTNTAPTPGQGGVGIEKLVSSPGGTAIARCAGGQIYLVSWSPEQGYRADDVARGPAAVASVKFESETNKVFVSVRCAGGEPRASVVQQADDHGGGRKGKDH